MMQEIFLLRFSARVMLVFSNNGPRLLVRAFFVASPEVVENSFELVQLFISSIP